MTPRSWFTSDLHLGDKHVQRGRGYLWDREEHDYWIAHLWDTLIRPRDHVWLLGDMSPLRSGWSDLEVLDWFAQRPGTKHLILGNHDLNRRWDDLVFATVAHEQRVRLGGQRALLSHYPRTKVERGELLLHGHIHRRTRGSVRWDGAQRIHVGWDAWRTFVTTDDLIAEARRWEKKAWPNSRH